MGGPFSCAVIMPTSAIAGKDNTVFKGKVIKAFTRRVSGVKEEILGSAFMVEGIFLTVGSVTEEMIKQYIENQGKQENQDFKIEQ